MCTCVHIRVVHMPLKTENASYPFANKLNGLAHLHMHTSTCIVAAV